MLNGLDLFSGIGGLSIALSDWVRPIAYCEIDSYCQGVLLTQMAKRSLNLAPIWTDVTTLSGEPLSNLIDIIYGGFPCQDISIAGLGKGLEGERSGLFFEIVRLSKEIKPKFIFLENVPAITSRGGLQVVREITEMGYDCRWCVISARSIGALHLRERWFLLAKSNKLRCDGRGDNREERHIQNDQERDIASPLSNGEQSKPDIGEMDSVFSDTSSLRCDKGAGERVHCKRKTIIDAQSSDSSSKVINFWENSEPPVCGVAHGLPFRVDQIRALGNAVVPQQAKEAFKILMGIHD